MTIYLLRYGEIGTKSESVRRTFISILIQNIERMFLKEGKEVIIERTRGRIFAYADEEVHDIFARTFGLVSYSPVIETTSDKDDILEACNKFWNNKKGSFAVRARRTGEHPYSSPELAAEAGGAVLEANPELEVDLTTPDHELHIEVRNEKAYLFGDIYPGPGGLPLGSQGKVAAYVENKNDFLATWLMMRRGARAYIVHPSENRWAELQDDWDPNLKRLGVGSLENLLSVELPPGIEGIVLGDTLKDLRDIEHELPIFQPLIGFTDKRVDEFIENISKLNPKALKNIRKEY